MGNTTTSPNMNLSVPSVGVDPGPDWANNLNSSLNIVDGHNHAPGSGVQVNPSGLNINSDLPVNNNNLTSARSLRFQAQTSAISGAADLGCLYESGVDLFYNDGDGNQIRLTSGGGIAGTPGSISNLVSPASASYVAASQTFVWQSAASTAANMDFGSIILRNSTASSLGLTLQAPTISGSDYTITLPQLPLANNALVVMSTAGVETTVSADPATFVVTGGVLSVETGGISVAQVAATAGLNPPGAIIAYGGVSAPTGWLLCDGTSYLRTAQATLFSAIGTAYGTADSTHFNVPDMRGQFLRMVTGSTSNDPDASSRTANNPGGATGNNVGSQQSDQYASHAHTIHAYDTENAGGGNVGWAGNSAGPDCVTQANGGSETRPKNIYVQYIIKT